MCQIQLIHKFDNKKLTEEDLEQFKSMLLSGSNHNDDAWGYYDVTNKKNNRYCGELQYKDMHEISKLKTTTLFGHNRLATHGKAHIIDNNHPFETENFVVVHNGVLSGYAELKKLNNLDYTIETDSFVIPSLLEKVYADLKDSMLTVKTVAEVLFGSFSVIVYSKTDNRLYYFKNDSTRFAFSIAKTKSGDILFGSTDEDNFKSLYTEFIRGDIIVERNIKISKATAKKGKIIELTSEGLFELDSFEESTYYKTRSSLWDSDQKKFIEIKPSYESTNTCTKSTVFGNRDYNTSYDGYGSTIKTTTDDKPDNEWIQACSDALKMVRKEMLENMEGVYDIKINHDKFNVFAKEIKFYADRILSDAEKRGIIDEFKDYGVVSIKDRVKSKISEIVMVVNEYMVSDRIEFTLDQKVLHGE